MNCSPTIAIALLLLSLTAGMGLLYKTKKESLGTWFKLAAWFIIIVSIGCMVCCGIRCVFCKKRACGTEQCGMSSGKGCMHGNEMHCKMKGEGCYLSEGAGDCHGQKMACCKNEGEGHEKEIEIRKDTVIGKE